MPTIQAMDLSIGQVVNWDIQMLPVVDISSWHLQMVLIPFPGSQPTIGSAPFPLPSTCIPPYQPMQIGPLASGAVVTKNNLLGGPGGLTITNGPLGEFQISWVPADTIPLNPGTYYWSVWRVDSGNNEPVSRGYVYLNT